MSSRAKRNGVEGSRGFAEQFRYRIEARVISSVPALRLSFRCCRCEWSAREQARIYSNAGLAILFSPVCTPRSSLARLLRSENNRRNRVVRQAVFGKIFTAHRGIDDLDIVVA